MEALFVKAISRLPNEANFLFLIHVFFFLKRKHTRVQSHITYEWPLIVSRLKKKCWRKYEEVNPAHLNFCVWTFSLISWIYLMTVNASQYIYAMEWEKKNYYVLPPLKFFLHTANYSNWIFPSQVSADLEYLQTVLVFCFNFIIAANSPFILISFVTTQGWNKAQRFSPAIL